MSPWDKFCLGSVGRVKVRLGLYLGAFRDWLATTGLGYFWIGLIVVGVIIAIAALLALVIGLVVCVPSLVLYLAFNWVVPVFGGPAITFKTAIGLALLIAILRSVLHKG